MRLAKLIPLTMVLLLSAVPTFAKLPWQHHGALCATSCAAARAAEFSAGQPGAVENAAKHYTFQPKGPGPHRGDWLRKYMALPPNEQEQKLQNDPSFRSLSPEKQNRLLDRLRKFNSQPPEKKAQILNRMETFEHMTPQQQQSARNLFDRYRNLPADQKDKVSQAYRRLRGMPPSARNEVLNSDEFRNNYNDEERDLCAA